mgnify:CR=1 FL=1|jgi:hypothetical protein
MIDELSRGASRLLEIVARDFERQNCRFIDGCIHYKSGRSPIYCLHLRPIDDGELFCLNFANSKPCRKAGVSHDENHR